MTSQNKPLELIQVRYISNTITSHLEQKYRSIGFSDFSKIEGRISISALAIALSQDNFSCNCH